MMSEPPCIAELRKQAGLDVEGVDRVIRQLGATVPVLRCHRTDQSSQLVALDLAALVPRIFPRIRLDTSDAELGKRMRAIILSINPDAELSGATGNTVISIGEQHPGAYVAMASGWHVSVASPGQDPPSLPPAKANPASALLAATLVTARVMAHIPDIIDARPAPTASGLNLWGPDINLHGPDLPENLQLDAHAFGHGSISNALWGALGHRPLSGSVTAVDDDAYEAHNLARYTFLDRNHLGVRKVIELQNRLAHQSSLIVTARPETIQAWSSRAELPPRVAVISPDNKLARAWAADTMPGLAVAASASDREAQVAYCNTTGGICSYCVFAPTHNTPVSQRDAIVAFTGLSLNDVVAFTREWNGQPPFPLNEAAVRIIESKMARTQGAFGHWIGKLLLDFLKVHQAALYSAAVVRTKAADRIHLPLPLASAAAGAIAMAGLLRMSLEGFDQAKAGFNHMWLNVWTGELRFMMEARPASMTCLCQNASRQQWRRTALSGE